MDKLKKHPEYRDKSEDELKGISEILSEKNLFRREYFGKYIDEACDNAMFECMDEAKKCLKEDENSMSDLDLHRSASDRFEKLVNFDMNLIIRSPASGGSKKATAKTPVVLALQVGGYVFKWDENSLVIPMEFKQVETEPRLLSPVLQKTKWHDTVEKERQSLQESIEQTVQDSKYEMQIKLHFDLSQEKDRFLSAFIDTVLRFNRDREYHQRRCNNQTFLDEAIKSLDIKRVKLSRSIKEHVDQLRPSRIISSKRITTHEQLDITVADVNTGQLSKEDVEYLIAKYFLFHVCSWEGEREADEWKCSVQDCKLLDLEKLMEKLTFISST